MSKIEVNTVAPQCGTTLTLGESGDTVTLGSGASQSGFGRTGTVDWDTTPKTATFSAVSGDGFFCNTTSGGFTANLPAGVAGAIVSFADYAGTWQTNNLTVSPNGSDKIGGTNADVILDTEGQSVTFIFVDSTQGWVNVQDSTSNERANPFVVATGGTITTSGNYKIHTFTGPGTFTVCTASSTAANNIVSYLVVAGGGGAGGNRAHIQGGGGGGSGGFREYKGPTDCYVASPLNGNPCGTAVTVSAQAYPITVGGGGSGGDAANSPSIPGSPGNAGTSGSNSIFSTITSAGGGRGAQPGTNPPAPASGAPGAAQTGGSGGGQGGNQPGSGAAGNTPPVTPPQGNNGGTADTTNYTLGGGGGGATAVGTNATAPEDGGGLGGAGATTVITASPVTYAAGGNSARPVPLCGPAGNAAVNTGNGGPANNYFPGPTARTPANYNGKNAGSGIVVIRYRFQ